MREDRVADYSNRANTDTISCYYLAEWHEKSNWPCESRRITTNKKGDLATKFLHTNVHSLNEINTQVLSLVTSVIILYNNEVTKC